jgi:hypothetical protein
MQSGAELVFLKGPAMVRLVRAVAAFEAADVSNYVIVGGIAVTARLGQAHRATVDVDAVVDDMAPPPTALEALLSLPDARRDNQADHRIYVEGTKIEIMLVGRLAPEDLDGIPELDALFVAAHTWALETATSLTIVADANPAVRATAPIATHAALLAMKLHAIQDRSAASASKRASDAWDIYRILVDLDADGTVRSALGAATKALRDLVRQSAERILITDATRTRSWLVQGDDIMASVTAEDLRLVARPLIDALR